MRNDKRNEGPKGPRGRKSFKKEEDKEFKEKLVYVNRVAKVVKGGRRTSVLRRSSFVGDEKGQVGAGLGKAAEIPDAIAKAVQKAKRSMIKVPIVGTTIPHEVIGVYGRGRVLLLPATEGTGVIAGGPARAVLELAGVKDIKTKSQGSNTPTNCVKATIEGLRALKTAEEYARLRGDQRSSSSGKEDDMGKLKIQLVKSPIGYDKKQKATLIALGLKKMNAVVEQEDTACIRGMIKKVTHLVKVLDA